MLQEPIVLVLKQLLAVLALVIPSSTRSPFFILSTEMRGYEGIWWPPSCVLSIGGHCTFLQSQIARRQPHLLPRVP